MIGETVLTVRKNYRTAADAVLLLQKNGGILIAVAFCIIPDDSVFPVLKARATPKDMIDILLRKRKSGGLFSLRLLDVLYLLRLARQKA